MRGDAAEKCGFSRASGFEDFRDRFMDQLAVGGKNILGVGIAMSDLCIKIGCTMLVDGFNRQYDKR